MKRYIDRYYPELQWTVSMLGMFFLGGTIMPAMPYGLLVGTILLALTALAKVVLTGLHNGDRLVRTGVTEPADPNLPSPNSTGD